ncbi:MAG: hypothetical protein SNH63_07915 [Rikenellaceae bacterium]
MQIDAQSSVEGAKELCVELLSKRTMLVPRELLMAHGAEGLEEVCRGEYAAGGMTIGDNEELLVVGDGDVVALVALAKSLIAELNGRGSGRVVYTSALLHERVSDVAHVVVDVKDGLSYIKVYSEDGLSFADVFEVSSVAQVAYWLQRLSAVMSLESYDLYLLRGDASLLSAVSSSFKQLRRCE